VEVRLGYLVQDWKGRNPVETQNDRMRVACTALAVDAVNARRGLVSTSLAAELRNNFSIRFDSIATFGDELDRAEEPLRALVDEQHIDALIIDGPSSYAMLVADYVNKRRVPTFLLGQTAPSFNERPGELWYQYFRMLPTALSHARQIVSFVVGAGWTHVAVLYVPEDPFCMGIVDTMRDASQEVNVTLHLYTLSENSVHHQEEAVINEIKSSGVKVLVSFFFKRHDEVQRLLEEHHILGAHSKAR
jgi:ABC-type branched-subunit amino acid transport system substrate-binding protein